MGREAATDPKCRDHLHPTPKAASGPPSELRLTKDTGEPELETYVIECGESREAGQEMTEVGSSSPSSLAVPKQGPSAQPGTGVC